MICIVLTIFTSNISPLTAPCVFYSGCSTHFVSQRGGRGGEGAGLLGLYTSLALALRHFFFSALRGRTLRALLLLSVFKRHHGSSAVSLRVIGDPLTVKFFPRCRGGARQHRDLLRQVKRRRRRHVTDGEEEEEEGGGRGGRRGRRGVRTRTTARFRWEKKMKMRSFVKWQVRDRQTGERQTCEGLQITVCVCGGEGGGYYGDLAGQLFQL